MQALVTLHHHDEGPGTLGEFLAAQGVALDSRHLYRDQSLPAGLADYQLMISMGGPMNVYEEADHPWLREEDRLIKEAVTRGLPFVGICLGAQLLAKALGARVYQAPVSEAGWYRCSLTKQGRADPLLKGLPAEITVFQWHQDTFAVPSGARLLVTGAQCRNQGFALGRAYGLQYHVEVSRSIIDDWLKDNDTLHDCFLGPCAAQEPVMAKEARVMYRNLLDLLGGPWAVGQSAAGV